MNLHDIQQDAGAEFIAFGPDEQATPIVASFEQYEAEYAAIRSRVGILHLPQRGLVHVTGQDRQDFLHRMMTQHINAMQGGATQRGFQLNHKGRIVADILIHHGDVSTWLELDAVDIPALRELLESRLFAEDVVLEDISGQYTKLSLHGPAGPALLQACCAQEASGPVDRPGTHHVLPLGQAHVTVYRWDDAGATGLHLWVPTEHASEIYHLLWEQAGFDPRDDPDDPATADRRRTTLRGRPVGWLAYNTARIEAGTALFHIDFGPDSLPAETGALDDTVSLNKGCYLGQEIVARMHNLGHPKRVVVALKFEADTLPVAGAAILEPAPPGQPATSGPTIGAITSSTISPMLGHTAIALATLKWGKHTPGRKVAVACEGQIAHALVSPTLRQVDA